MKFCTLVISDLHAGAPGSLLTVLDDKNEPLRNEVSPTTSKFCTALRATLAEMGLSQKPDLVLLGDALDFSLARPRDSVSVLKGFLSELCVPEEFADITFLAGNHDHELWSAQRFSPEGTGIADPDTDSYWSHTSCAFAPRDAVGTSTMLNAVLRSAGSDQTVASYYPNLGYAPLPGSAPGDRRAIVLHHGHFVESMYKAMTYLVAAMTAKPTPPMTAEGLETANGSWIDFGWSVLGFDGKVGKEVSLGERLLQTGGGAHAFQQHLSKLLAGWAQDSLPIPHSHSVSQGFNLLSQGFVDGVVGGFSQLERYGYTEHLGLTSRKGLRDYIAQVVKTQMDDELDADAQPDHTTFIFGHTHKPFSDQIVVPGFKRPVSVYNTGGWVVDTSLLSTVEGASVVFIDDEHNTATLQIYQMPDGHEIQCAHVSSADPRPDAENPLVQALTKAVKAAHPAWHDFRNTVITELQRKQEMYLTLGEEAEQKYQPLKRAK